MCYGHLRFLERGKVNWKGCKNLKMLAKFLLNNSHFHPLFSIRDLDVYRQRKVKCIEYIQSTNLIIRVNTFYAHDYLMKQVLFPHCTNEKTDMERSINLFKTILEAVKKPRARCEHRLTPMLSLPTASYSPIQQLWPSASQPLELWVCFLIYKIET